MGDTWSYVISNYVIYTVYNEFSQSFIGERKASTLACLFFAINCENDIILTYINLENSSTKRGILNATIDTNVVKIGQGLPGGDRFGLGP